MMTAPFHSPMRVKRRLTPPKPASALRTTSALTPSACATAMAAVDDTDIGLRVLTISENAAIFELADQRLDNRMIRAHHRKPIERNVLDEGTECVLHGFERAEVIEMLGIDVGDDGDVGGQLEKRAVGFIRLDHHPVSGAEPRIGAVGIDDAAVDHGGVEAAGIQQGRNE